MRRLIIPLALLLVLLPSAYAACVGGTPNGVVEGTEQCDDGNTVNGDGCSSSCFLEKDSDFVLFDFGMAHNLLFSKVQDLLHVIKHSLFQLELKVVEVQLTNFECDQQPVSFWMPASVHPYGKLEEIDAMTELLIQSIEDEGASVFGLTGGEVSTASGLLSDADGCITAGEYREAFECKCLAYDTLQGGADTSVTCTPCGGPVL